MVRTGMAGKFLMPPQKLRIALSSLPEPSSARLRFMGLDLSSLFSQLPKARGEAIPSIVSTGIVVPYSRGHITNQAILDYYVHSHRVYNQIHPEPGSIHPEASRPRVHLEEAMYTLPTSRGLVIVKSDKVYVPCTDGSGFSNKEIEDFKAYLDRNEVPNEIYYQAQRNTLVSA